MIRTLMTPDELKSMPKRQFVIMKTGVYPIKVLETELNVKLFSRKGRSFTLIPAGEYFYQKSKGTLEEIEGIHRETIRLGEDRDRELQLRIGYISCYSGLELHRAVTEFVRIYPEVSIHIIINEPMRNCMTGFVLLRCIWC